MNISSTLWMRSLGFAVLLAALNGAVPEKAASSSFGQGTDRQSMLTSRNAREIYRLNRGVTGFGTLAIAEAVNQGRSKTAFPGHAVSGTPSITVSAPTIVVRSEDMNPSGVPWMSARSRASLDTVITVINKGSNQYWLNSRGNGNYARFLGTPLKPFAILDLIKPMYEAFGEERPKFPPDGTKAKYWIVNTYQAEDIVIAFVHVEHTDLINKNSGHGRIGLAVSKDYGASFNYVGDIISPHNDGVFNVQGAPYIIKDGFFYVYAKELCKPSDSNGFGGATIVSRAPMEEVIGAARQGHVTEWRKYHDGQWESPALGGACTGISISPEGINHTDAAYSTFSETYFLALSMNTGHGQRNTWIKLFESQDGINWKIVKTIVEEPAHARAVGFQYVTIVNADGSDNAVVDREFFIYSGGETPESGSQGVIYRWAVKLSR